MISITAALFSIEDETQRNELKEYYRKNKDLLYNIALEKTKNREDAEDAVHEAFLRVIKYSKKFFQIPDDKRTAYMVIVLKNIILNKQKKTVITEELSEDICDDNCSVEEYVIGNLSYNELVEFICHIPDTLKEPLMLKVVYGLSNTEIADMLKISETAVRKRISDCYRIIREHLKGDNDDE